MTSQMNVRFRKGASVLVLLLLVVNIYLLLIMPLQGFYNRRADKIAALQDEYQDYYSISLAREELEKQAKRINSLREGQGYFLQSDNNALAAAELQTYIKKIIEKTGGRLLSTQPITAADSDTLHTVHVRVRMQGKVSVLLETLYALEAGKPTVVLENVLLSHVNVGKQYTKKMTENAISISFDIVGFMRVS